MQTSDKVHTGSLFCLDCSPYTQWGLAGGCDWCEGVAPRPGWKTTAEKKKKNGRRKRRRREERERERLGRGWVCVCVCACKRCVVVGGAAA